VDFHVYIKRVGLPHHSVEVTTMKQNIAKFLLCLASLLVSFWISAITYTYDNLREIRCQVYIFH
jgi:hypothetical protein